MPTREAYAVTVLTLLIFFVAFNIQSGWVFAVDALLVGLLAAGYLSARHAVWRISVHRTLPADAVEGEPVIVGLEVRAAGFGRRRFVEVVDEVAGLDPAQVALPAIDGRKTTRVFYRTRAVRRGIHQAHSTIVRSAGLTGLFAARRAVAAPGAITVYPRYWRLARFPLAAWTPAVHTAGATRRRGGLEFYGLRDYRPGDSMRHVHWRSSARRGSLMVREFEQDVPGAVTLLIDTRPDVQAGGETENTFEDLIRAAASIAWYVNTRGGTVRLIASTESGPLDVTGGWNPILRALAGLRPAGRLAPVQVAAAVDLGRNPAVVVLTPDEGVFIQLAAAEVHAAGVLADVASYAGAVDDAAITRPAGPGDSAVPRIAAAPKRGSALPACVIRRGDDIGARLEQSGG
jgi:uncharacterized protein (DUF58 family)